MSHESLDEPRIVGGRPPTTPVRRRFLSQPQPLPFMGLGAEGFFFLWGVEYRSHVQPSQPP